MRKGTAFVLLLLSMVVLLASAQEAELAEPTLYEPFGGVGFEVGAYEPLEGYEAGTFDEALGGNLYVQVASPSDQAVDVTLVGPDGLRQTSEVEAERLFESLTPGVYSIMATDDGLQPIIGKVEVALGRLAPVTLTMNEAGFLYDAAAYEAFEPYGYGYEAGYEPLEAGDTGNLIVRVVGPGTAGDYTELGVEAVVSVVGPNDYRQDFATEGTLEGLESGAYGVAATAEGYEMAQAVTEARLGEVATVTLSLSPLEGVDTAAVTEAEAVDYTFEDFDADADGFITEEEFVGVYGDADLFGEFDTDADGFISEEEFNANEGLFQ